MAESRSGPRPAARPHEAATLGAWGTEAVARLRTCRARCDGWPPSTRWLYRLGVLIAVRSEDETLLGALADFYHPYYSFAQGLPPREPDITLTLLVGNGRVPTPVPSSDMRIFRRRPAEHCTAGDWRLMARDDADIVIAVDDERREVVILGSSAHEVRLQARVLLRDQILQRVEHAAGSWVFHAAAVARGGHGVVVMGDRNCGKTTALLNLLGAGTHDFVTADRLSLTRNEHGRIVMEGVPARANVHEVAFEPGEPLHGLIDGVDWDAAAEGKVLVDVPALTAHFGARAVPAAEPTTILLPHIDAATAVPKTEVIEDVTRGRELLRRNLLEGDVPGNTHRPWLALPITDAPQRQRATVDAVLDELIRQCRLLAFRGTYAAYTDWLATINEREAI
ncbi:MULTISPECIES: hypothetical protein [unclassified Streptomyces]|uniref:hypothetical protein n=1 Tax=unclassified Streptomyces TaxID=2593676 RepID=UPI0036E1AF10